VKPQLVSEYVESGIVRFEYRDYPFRSPESVRAAEAAACASDQGAYWRYHDTLFLNQSAPNGFSDARLKQVAETLGLDTGAFNSCLDSGEKRKAVEQSIADAQAQGIDSTPTLFINGSEIAEWYDFNAVKQAIDAELAQMTLGDQTERISIDWPTVHSFRASWCNVNALNQYIEIHRATVDPRHESLRVLATGNL
jgi:protein-disulfide isomerase